MESNKDYDDIEGMLADGWDIDDIPETWQQRSIDRWKKLEIEIELWRAEHPLVIAETVEADLIPF